ncbi:MAG: caspase family protein [Bacteroidota bacterium]
MNHALLVGINRYGHLNTSELYGPENDLALMKSYLENEATSPFICEVLKGQKASRQGIIDAFRTHLSQTPAGEIALFYFSGHGVKRKSPLEFLDYQDDAYHENIMCYDSKTEDYELADKELKWLIKELTSKPDAPQVVVILDCCYSGSVTRLNELEALTVRRAPINVHERGLDTFIEGSVDKDNLETSPPHIFLGACGPREEALEKGMVVHGENGKIQIVSHGLFTYFLIQALRKENGRISYRNLIDTIRLKVHQSVSSDKAYNPRLEVFGYYGNHLHFLNHQYADEADKGYLVFHEDWQKWVINQGIAHGLEAGSEAVYEVQYEQNGQEISFTVKTTAVGLAASPVDMSRKPSRIFLSKSNVFPAVAKLIRRKRLVIKDPEGTLSNWEEVLPIAEGSEETSPLCPKDNLWYYPATRFRANFQLSEKIGAYQIDLVEGHYNIRHTETQKIVSGLQLRTSIEGRPTFPLMAHVLDQIGQWERAVYLDNPAYSKPAHVQFFFQDKKHKEDHKQPHVTLDYNPYLQDPRNFFNLKVLQTGNENLYFWIIYLSRYFQVKPIGVEQELSPLQRALTMFAKDKSFSIRADEKGKRPYQVVDILKLVGSHSSLPYLRLGKEKKLEDQLRDFRDGGDDRSQWLSGDLLFENQWFSQNFYIKSLLSLGNIGPRNLYLKDVGLQFQGHPIFRAKVGLSSSARHLWVSKADRYLKHCAKILNVDLHTFEEGDSITQIELFETEHQDSLVQQPLVLELRTEKPDNMVGMALTLPPSLEADPDRPSLFQGLGEWKLVGQGTYALSISSIPENPPDGRAVPGRSLKISTFWIPKDRVEEIRSHFM